MIIDDVLGNVTAAVKRANSVIIVTTWVVNLHLLSLLRGDSVVVWAVVFLI